MNGYAQESDLFRKAGHKTELKAISISPDNKYFISVENDTLAILWDIATGQQLRTIKNVEAASFKNNSSIYLAMSDKTFKQIDLDGQTIKTYGSRGARYNFINRSVYERTPRMFYPEKGLYIFGDDVFDFEKGYVKRLPVPASGYNEGRDFSPVTNQLAVADKKTGKISFINVESGLVISTVQTDNLKEENMKLGFSPNGEKLLLTKPSAFLLIDVPAGKIQRTIKNSKGDGEFGAFAPDGETLALVVKDYNKYIGQITMLDIKSGAAVFVKEFKDVGFFVNMQISPDGKNLGLWFHGLSDDKQNVLLLDTKKGTINWQYNWLYKPGEFSSATFGSNITFSPDGQKIVFGNMKKLWLIGTNSGLAEKTFSEISQGSVSGIHFINDNSRMVSSTREHIFIWNLQTGEMEKSLFVKEKTFEDRVDKYAPSVDGKKFYVLREDNLRELDSTGKMTVQYTGTKKMEYRTNVAVSYNGQYVMNQGVPVTGFCTANRDAYTLEIFDTKTHKLVYTNNCVEGFAAFAKTQNMLVIQEKSNAAPLRFYELPSGKLVYEIKVPNTANKYNRPVFSQNDRYLTMTASEYTAGYTEEILIDLKTKTVKTIPVTIAAAIDKRNDKYAMITPKGFAYGEKYIVYEGWRTRNVLFYDTEQGKFDEQLTFNYPAGITGFSAINISPNGKFLLLGTYDGSIMLWDIEHKKLQGTIYPDAAKGNWAVIDPQGQFDANAGAQNDMFHVSGNTVVPLNSMFEKFYTPRLLPRILSGENFVSAEIDIKKLKKAPTVKMQFKENARNLEVADDDVQTIETKFSSASVAITAECPLDAVTEIRLYQNGKLVETTRNLTVEDEKQGDKTMTKTFGVNLVEGPNRFRAIAFNTERTESRPLEINVVFKPEKNDIEIKNVTETQLHIIVVGINIYKNTKYNLNYAMDDAEAFKIAVGNGAKGLFSTVNTHFIKDAEATKAGIVAALEKVKDQANAQDVFIFYFAGHGVVNDKKAFYLVPSDVVQLYGSDDALAQKGLSAANLQQFSKDIKAQKQLYILDACQSAGALEDIVAARGAVEEKAIAQLARSTGTHWLTASGSTQFASEFSQLGHGAFTYCLLEALKGGADNGDKKISIKELDTYLQLKVPEVTQKYKGTAQYPASYGYGNDFPIIILK
jgi:WD40 repeat protein